MKRFFVCVVLSLLSGCVATSIHNAAPIVPATQTKREDIPDCYPTTQIEYKNIVEYKLVPVQPDTVYICSHYEISTLECTKWEPAFKAMICKGENDCTVWTAPIPETSNFGERE
jgi:hypothetical protein